MDARSEVFADYRIAGLSLKAHPVSFFRRELDQLGVIPAAQLKALQDGRFVRVAGLVLVRQRPGTAKGITFVTIEDETKEANLIIRMDIGRSFTPLLALRRRSLPVAACRTNKASFMYWFHV